ncbi:MULTISPECIES: glycosyltransferase family 2 protein [unclassified Psychrobacter]|uniref:glycosyltransferase family 2 protein n=1 Tax=unclassified Psychrobacter TaxID=196806 RepID=UPI003FD1CA5D
MDILFSVIIPLYNKADYIFSTLESVLAQTCKNFEVIVVDDGSNDASLAVVQKITDPRLQVISQNNSGVSAARNKGIAIAKAKWVAFLDADDIWLPNHLETLLEVSKNHPEAEMIATGHKALKREAINGSLNHEEESEIKLINYFLESQVNISILNSSCTAIKREFFDSNKGFKDYKRGEDLELWARVALNYPVAISTTITSIYVQDTGGAMDTGHWSKDKPNSIDAIKLEDVSPSSAFLYDNLPNHYSPDIVDYINARVMSHIRANCIRKDAATAKKISSFLIKPLRYRKPSERFYRHVLLLPSSSINSIFNCRKKVTSLLKTNPLYKTFVRNRS